MFEINVQKSFRASHALRNYRGGMEDSHEHEWRCEVRISARTLDEAGCVADFVDVDRGIDEIVLTISEKAIHETPAFSDTSASAENIAKYLFDKLSDQISDDRKQVTRVTVWEDEGHSAAYTK